MPEWKSLNPSLMAIDFDDTFTVDPSGWTLAIQLLQRRGHRFVCVSAREDILEQRQKLRRALPDDVCILLTSGQQKREFAKRAGFEVDIWIDDCPEAIPDVSDLAHIDVSYKDVLNRHLEWFDRYAELLGCDPSPAAVSVAIQQLQTSLDNCRRSIPRHRQSAIENAANVTGTKEDVE